MIGLAGELADRPMLRRGNYPCVYHVCLAAEFVDRVAVIDWCSRYVVSWAVSMTMEVAFCVEALDQASAPGPARYLQHHPRGAVHRSGLTERLQKGGNRISRDGRGRPWTTCVRSGCSGLASPEEVYLRDDQSVRDAAEG